MFDVDHFEHINDTRGHLWGNEVLARVGHKAEEIVGKAGCVARWGGDEFIGFIDAPGDAEETFEMPSGKRARSRITTSPSASARPASTPKTTWTPYSCAWTTACTAPKPKAATASPTFEAQADGNLDPIGFTEGSLCWSRKSRSAPSGKSRGGRRHDVWFLHAGWRKCLFNTADAGAGCSFVTI